MERIGFEDALTLRPRWPVLLSWGDGYEVAFGRRRLVYDGVDQVCYLERGGGLRVLPRWVCDVARLGCVASYFVEVNDEG